jgi:hypothetical protein
VMGTAGACAALTLAGIRTLRRGGHREVLPDDGVRPPSSH